RREAGASGQQSAEKPGNQPPVHAAMVCQGVGGSAVVKTEGREGRRRGGSPRGKTPPYSTRGGEGSMHHERVLREFGVAVQGLLDLFLGRRVQLPGIDLALECLRPRAVEVDLLVGALVDDLEAVARDARRRLAL